MILNSSVEDIVSFFMNSPTKAYNINEIARNTEVSVGTAFNVLKTLNAESIFDSKKIGKSTIYSLNLSNQVCLKVCELILAKKKLEFFEKIKDIQKKNVLDSFASEMSDEAAAVFCDSTQKMYLIAGKEDSKLSAKVNMFNRKYKTNFACEVLTVNKFLNGIYKEDKDSLKILSSCVLLSKTYQFSELLSKLYHALNKEVVITE